MLVALVTIENLCGEELCKIRHELIVQRVSEADRILDLVKCVETHCIN